MGKRKLRKALVEKYRSRCFYCGNPVTEDHVTREHLKPRSQGGPSTLGNLRLAHRRCNAKAADKLFCEKIAMRRVTAEYVYRALQAA